MYSTAALLDMSRKCKSITVKEKNEILIEFEKFSRLRLKINLTKMMCISVSTLKIIIHDHQNIEEQAKVCGSLAPKKNQVQEGKFRELDKKFSPNFQSVSHVKYSGKW